MMFVAEARGKMEVLVGNSMENQSGWWYTYPSEKHGFVNWDDSSQYMQK